MGKANYRMQMDEIVERMRGAGERKRLLLHVCCAPCSSYCLELLTQFFDVTVLFYNPNITEAEEYTRRLEEEKRLIALFNEEIDKGQGGVLVPAEAKDGFTASNGMADDSATDDGIADSSIRRSKIAVMESRYDPEAFLEAAKGLENEPEGGERCRRCFTLRLNEAAAQAAAGGFDFFTTSLTISPLKNADVLNETGQQAGAAHGVAFLPSDFKKKNGYQRSIELSKACNLYRQDYCGCVYSKAARRQAKPDAVS